MAIGSPAGFDYVVPWGVCLLSVIDSMGVPLPAAIAGLRRACRKAVSGSARVVRHAGRELALAAPAQNNREVRPSRSFGYDKRLVPGMRNGVFGWLRASPGRC
jgi:hypothetical protein